MIISSHRENGKVLMSRKLILSPKGIVKKQIQCENGIALATGSCVWGMLKWTGAARQVC